jgi:PAP_fibrillin
MAEQRRVAQKHTQYVRRWRNMILLLIFLVCCWPCDEQRRDSLSWVTDAFTVIIGVQPSSFVGHTSVRSPFPVGVHRPISRKTDSRLRSTPAEEMEEEEQEEPLVVVVVEEEEPAAAPSAAADIEDATAGLKNATSFLSPARAVGENNEPAPIEEGKTRSSPETAEITNDAGSATSTTSAATSSNNLLFVTTVGASTNRGEFATAAQKKAVRKVVSELESSANNRVPKDDLTTTMVDSVTGTWELVYTDTQLFRGSPFFLAGRATCRTESDVEKYNWFCEMHRQALAISQVLAVRQIITNDTMINEFEVSVAAIPFLHDFTPFSYSGGLPVTITGAIVSTASVTMLTDPGVPSVMELYMDTVQIKGSNIPFLRQALDLPQVQLRSRSLARLLEEKISSYEPPKPILTTTFLTNQFRITKDQDDHIYIYVRTSTATTPTDYSTKTSDLGLLRLLEGFNDAVTKIYI